MLELEDQLHTQAQSEVDRTQREFYLRERMKAIQSELGEGDPWAREIYEIQTRVEVGRTAGGGADTGDCVRWSA